MTLAQDLESALKALKPNSRIRSTEYKIHENTLTTTITYNVSGGAAKNYKEPAIDSLLKTHGFIKVSSSYDDFDTNGITTFWTSYVRKA